MCQASSLICKRFCTLVVLWLSAAICIAKEQDLSSFPRPAKDVEVVENQFIVQYEVSNTFNSAKWSTTALNANDVQVVRYIDSSNIGVVKFPSEKAAEEWRLKNAEHVKYFEAGE